MTTHDLLAPLFEDGVDPRTRRGRLIVPQDKVANGFVSYGGAAIQIDRHGPLAGAVGWRADRTIYALSDLVVVER